MSTHIETGACNLVDSGTMCDLKLDAAVVQEEHLTKQPVLGALTVTR